MRRHIGNLLFALVGLSILVAPSSWSAEKVKFGTGVAAHPVQVLPILTAEEKGFWKSQNVAVDWIPFKGGTAMFQGVAGGHVDMGTTVSPGFVQAASRGVPVILVVDLGQRYPFYLWVIQDSPIKQPNDMKGKKIATSRFGGVSHAYGRLALNALGLKGKVEWIASGGLRNTIAAFKARQIDIAVLTKYAMTPLILNGQAREIVAIRDYVPKEWIDTMVYARTAFAKSNPKELRGVVKGLLQAGGFINENPGWAIEKIKSKFRYTDEMAKFTYKLLKYGTSGKINRKGLENVRNFLIKYEIISREKAPAVDRLFTEKFIP
ncbi:MAG: ABC transporter substrate-binding protein [Thermodesulfobacteriota bacterium]